MRRYLQTKNRESTTDKQQQTTPAKAGQMVYPMKMLEEILQMFEQHPLAVRAIVLTVFLMIVAGGAIIYRIRGSRIRSAMREWEGLFSDLNTRVASLYRELTDVRQELETAKARLATAIATAEAAEQKSLRQQQEIMRLQRRVRELAKKESELKQRLQIARQQEKYTQPGTEEE